MTTSANQAIEVHSWLRAGTRGSKAIVRLDGDSVQSPFLA